MKNICFTLLIFSTLLCQAQPGNHLMEDLKINSSTHSNIQFVDQTRNAVDSCGHWTGYYVMNKLTALEGYYISRNEEYSGFAQYYSAPQPLSINGIGFYGYAETLDSIAVLAEVREADPVDSLPGAVLASDTMYVQNGSFQTNFLGQQYYEAIFDTALVVTAGYNLSIQILTTDTVVLYSSSYGNIDGNGEYLNSLYYSDPAAPSFEGWYRSSDFGPSFDADFLILPILKTEIFEPYQILTNDTICEGDNLCVDYSRKPIFEDHMYADSNYISNQSIDWLWGDGFVVNGLTNACHFYDTTSLLTLTDTFYYWNVPSVAQPLNCAIEESATITVFKSPTVDFNYVINGTEVSFTNNSYNATSYSWDFGDGNNANDPEPTHDFVNNGSYTVTLYGENDCFIDSLKDTIDITTAGIINQENYSIQLYPNPTRNNLNITNSSESELNVEIYNTDGRLIEKIRLVKDLNTVDISNWSEGIYIIKSENNLWHSRFIKQ